MTRLTNRRKRRATQKNQAPKKKLTGHLIQQLASGLVGIGLQLLYLFWKRRLGL